MKSAYSLFDGKLFRKSITLLLNFDLVVCKFGVSGGMLCHCIQSPWNCCECRAYLDDVFLFFSLLDILLHFCAHRPRLLRKRIE